MASKIWKTQLHWIEFFPRSSQLMENIVVKNLFLFLPLFQFWNGVLVFIFLGVVVKVLFGLGLFLFLIYLFIFIFFIFSFWERQGLGLGLDVLEIVIGGPGFIFDLIY